MDAVSSPAAQTTLPGVLDAAAERDADRVLLRCQGRDLALGELHAASVRAAGALVEWGIARGDRVAIMMSNSPEFLHAWFGVVRSGAIEVAVHDAYRGPLLEHILAESGARVLFCDAEFVPRLEGLSLPALERVVVHGPAPDGVLDGVRLHTLAEALQERP